MTRTPSWSHRPLISIIMPAYNTEQYIGSAIESVLRQTWCEWELIIVNDGSTDQTEAVIQDYAARDNRICYSSVANTGKASRVRNLGLLQAQGQYMTFLDSDDEYLPQALETLICVFLKEPDTTAVYAFETTVNEQGQPLKEHADGLFKIGDGQYILADSSLPTWNNLVMGTVPHCMSGLMLTRETVLAVGPLDETLTFAEDMQYKIRLFLHSFDTVRIIPAITFRVRIRGNSTTKLANKLEDQVRNEQQFLEWLFFRIELSIDLSPWRSRKYTSEYRLIAGSRFFVGQRDLALRVLQTAWQDPNIEKKDWLKHCASLFARCFLPIGLDRSLKNLLQL